MVGLVVGQVSGFHMGIPVGPGAPVFVEQESSGSLQVLVKVIVEAALFGERGGHQALQGRCQRLGLARCGLEYGDDGERLRHGILLPQV